MFRGLEDMVVLEGAERALVRQTKMGCEVCGRSRRGYVDSVVVVARIVARREVVSCRGKRRCGQQGPKVNAHGESAARVLCAAGCRHVSGIWVSWDVMCRPQERAVGAR